LHILKRNPSRQGRRKPIYINTKTERSKKIPVVIILVMGTLSEL
jgi:hypothetical protein